MGQFVEVSFDIFISPESNVWLTTAMWLGIMQNSKGTNCSFSLDVKGEILSLQHL